MTHHDFALALDTDARAHLAAHLGFPIAPTAPASFVRDLIESTYLGGWSTFESNFRATYVAPRPVRESHASGMSPVKLRVTVGHYLGRRLREYDEVLAASFSDTHVVILVSIATVERLSRRDKVTARDTVLHTFTRTEPTERWSQVTAHYSDDVDEAFVRYGGVTTPERHAANVEAYETCYRPGTDRNPMSGWVARAGMSHEQAHRD